MRLTSLRSLRAGSELARYLAFPHRQDPPVLSSSELELELSVHHILFEMLNFVTLLVFTIVAASTSIFAAPVAEGMHRRTSVYAFHQDVDVNDELYVRAVATNEDESIGWHFIDRRLESPAALDAIGDEATGVLDVEWKFLDRDVQEEDSIRWKFIDRRDDLPKRQSDVPGSTSSGVLDSIKWKFLGEEVEGDLS
ncbi:unnamed protein product [Peniophora sp. CBMAI 1063]|nr:unnamed protein product [Peniophora sp. CBMAI 1063]